MDRTVVFRNALRICLILAPILSSVMSLTSDYNRHPDEIHHFEAARYYADHFLPPEIGDPAVRNSYSVWGVSYLNYHWIEYVLAGTFIRAGSVVGVGELTAARLCNVALFAAVAIFFLYRSRGDDDTLILPSFLLITPQVWYVFSYVNNDGFPLALSFVAAYQALHPDSSLNRFLEDREPANWFRGAITGGIILGLLLISKTNYYAFLVFITLWILHRHWPFSTAAGERPRIDRALCRRFALIGLIGVALLGFRCSLDFYVNGETNFVGLSYANYFLGNFEKQESKLLRYQEEVADPAFKPSVIERDLASTFPEMKLKEKGTSFAELFTKWRWHENSFKSFVGVYGYMNIFAGRWYYRLMAFLYIAFGIYLVAIVLRRGGRAELSTAILFTIGAGISLFISSYLSWSYALQAQGRYLFPILPMLAILVFELRKILERSVLTGLVLVCFTASTYCFLLTGVAQIDSAPAPETSVDTAETTASIVIRSQHR